MERWDLYTQDREKTGKTMVRGDKTPEGFFHLQVHVCIFNTRGEMLIQQRQSAIRHIAFRNITVKIENSVESLIRRVKMGRIMLAVVIHTDDDAIEHRNRWHTIPSFIFMSKYSIAVRGGSIKQMGEKISLRRRKPPPFAC